MLYITRRHTSKLEGFYSINTSCVMNSFCKKMVKTDSNVCSKCYGKNLEAFRKRDKTIPYAKSWYNNSLILSSGPLKKIPKFKVPSVRFHSVGELINKQHYLNFILIAKASPQTIFVLWTKRKNIVKGIERPSNMLLIYSEPKINKEHKKAPKGFNKVFTVYNKKFAKENNIEINCEQKCITCMKCYSHNNIQVINETMKKEKSV